MRSDHALLRTLHLDADEARGFLERFPSAEALEEADRTCWEDRLIEALALEWVSRRERLLDKTYGIFFERQYCSVMLANDADAPGLSFSGFGSRYQKMSARQEKQCKKFGAELSDALKASPFTPQALVVLKKRGVGSQVSLESMDACLRSLMTPEHAVRLKALKLEASWSTPQASSLASKPRF